MEKYPEGSNRKPQDNQALIDEIANLRAQVRQLEELARVLAGAVRPDPQDTQPDTRNKKIEYSGMFQ